MPCYHPKPGWRIIKRNPNGVDLKEPCLRPCGGCIGCRLDKASEWAARIYHESTLHEKSCFITLTYRDADLPKDRSISKDTLQKFFKRLRKAIAYKGNMPKYDKAMRIQFYRKKSHPKYGEPKVAPVYRTIKYYACGEYGDRLGRPHYHAVILGYDFADKEIIHKANVKHWKNKFKTGTDNDLYKSQFLEEIWPYGFNTIGEVTMHSAGYVARYTMKKIYGDLADDHYNGKTPEFALMSKGIGKQWIKRFRTDCYPKDYVTYKGKKIKIPRYYDNITEQTNPKLIEEVRKKRQEKSDPEVQREYPRKERYRKHVAKQLKRKI
jgi:hypothetical protein